MIRTRECDVILELQQCFDQGNRQAIRRKRLKALGWAGLVVCVLAVGYLAVTK